MIRDYLEDHDWPIWAGLGLLLVGVLFIAYKDEVAWFNFAVAHECQKIGEVSGSVGVGNTFNFNGGVGVTTVYIPGKTGYACNNGQTYWR